MNRKTSSILGFLGTFVGAISFLLQAGCCNGLSAVSQDQKLKLISFDLDDTLFPITETLEDANKAMIDSFMDEFGVEVSMASVREATVDIRKVLKSPITYSELRVRAFESELQRGGYTGDARTAAEIVFDAWLEERHAAADRWLFPKVTETLEILRNDYPSTPIAAITNGRGNPFFMPRLKDFFDFCVSGEDDDVFPERKPHRGIYDAALARAGLASPFLSDSSSCWVHVGDDLANDVGGAAQCGAFAVHAIIKEEQENEKTIFWSTAPAAEQEERRRKNKEAQSKVSARIHCVSELPDAIVELMK